MDQENRTLRQINENDREENLTIQKPNPSGNDKALVKYNLNKSSQSTMPLALQDLPSKGGT